MSTTAIYLTLIFSSFVREQAQRRQIRSAFGQYLSPALVEQLAQSPEKLVLGGEEREMTIMFSDVRGFTSISETYKHDPQGPDGADEPLPDAADQRDHRAQRAPSTNIWATRSWRSGMRRSTTRSMRSTPARRRSTCSSGSTSSTSGASRRRRRAVHVYIPLNVGVGLNTGVCVVGNMGSDLRFDYSVLGDSVNLASRLEGQSKEYGFPIIVGSKTALAVKEKFAILELDFIMVKGKKEPEVIYAIAGREDVAQSGRFQRLRNLTIEMLACYRSRDWDGALAAIERGRRTDEARALERALQFVRGANPRLPGKTRRPQTGTARSRY